MITLRLFLLTIAISALPIATSRSDLPVTRTIAPSSALNLAAANDGGGLVVSDARVSLATAFGTGHLFDMGECALVATRIASACFESIPTSSNPRRSGAAVVAADVEERECSIHIERSPCWSGALKYTVTSRYGDCFELAILYANDAENCLRRTADARFWAAIGYGFIVALMFIVLACIVGFVRAVCAG